MLSEIVPISSIIISILALLIALISWRANMRASRLVQHYSHIVTADSMFAENKKLLRFHGINHETIEEVYRVTSTELSYLLQSFNAGSISYLIPNKKNNEIFRNGSYRYNILKNESTQRAFPLIKQLFGSKNPYI